ncbi:MAG: aminoacetone oxidase family FAD-binding enzyme [Clostridia bacterium]|nr:aminoacetone oxidase family FAD-binding enzyme [Clostridia bacterium]
MMLKNKNEKQNIAIIGGGASGLVLAKKLCDAGLRVCVYERGERLGKKLSATGNGQGNITNRNVTCAEYFSVGKTDEKVSEILQKYDDKQVFDFFASLGVLLFFDERGRAYPTGRQASALTDVLRFYLQENGVETRLSTWVTDVKKQGETFVLTAKTQDGEKRFVADTVVFCTGGTAQKNFGTDGNAYARIRALGHTITKLYPSLVQLKTDTAHTKTLKGIRVADARLTATYEKNGERKTVSVIGDVIFTEYGVSGDAVFRISAFVTDVLHLGVTLSIDFLPEQTKESIATAIENKKSQFVSQSSSELLCGIVNNQIGRAIVKRENTADSSRLADGVKNFTLSVTGSLGFDYAQVTKGGVPLCEVTEGLQSKKVQGVYFAGETLDVDGQCGGFNLQWAFSSACAVADAIIKDKGQV